MSNKVNTSRRKFYLERNPGASEEEIKEYLLKFKRAMINFIIGFITAIVVIFIIIALYFRNGGYRK